VPTGSESILLVEDEAALGRLLRDVLTERGYTVLLAANGREALTMADAFAGRIDLLVTDVMMPEMNGREVARRLRRDNPTARVIYMSGYARTAILDRGLAEPGAAFLQKPCGIDVVLRTVHEVLQPARRNGTR